MRSPAALAGAVAAAVLFVAAVVLALRARHAEPARVAVYLTPWASPDDIQRVYSEVLGAPRPNGRGFNLRDGITGVSRAGDEGQTVLFVYLRADLPAAERDSLLAAVRASPLVARVEPAGRM